MFRYDPQTSMGHVELPTGLKLGHGDQGKLVRDVVIKELSGAEEDVLASNTMSVLKRINTVLQNCVVSIGDIKGPQELAEAIQDMPSGDRLAVIIGLRMLSLGNMYDMKITCDKCGHVSKASLNLEEIETDEPKDPLRRVFTTKLPGRQYKNATWAILTGRGDELLENLRKKHPDSQATLGIMVRLLKLGDKELDLTTKKGARSALKLVKGLGARDRNALRTAFKKEEGGLDLSFEWDCPKCGAELKGKVDVGQPGFFFPSET